MRWDTDRWLMYGDGWANEPSYEELLRTYGMKGESNVAQDKGQVEGNVLDSVSDNGDSSGDGR